MTGRSRIFDAFAGYAEAPPGRRPCRTGTAPGRDAALGGMFEARHKKMGAPENSEAPAARKNDII